MAALLDVNILVALFDPDHIHHEIAHDWFADHREAGWATCSITDNGLVRVLAQPSYGAGLRAVDVVDRLRRFTASGHHVFWDDRQSIANASAFRTDLIANPRQVTDVHLLGLAVQHGGCLATLDHSIPWRAVVGASADRLQVIEPAGDGSAVVDAGPRGRPDR